MIRLLVDGVGAGLVAAAMTVIIPMIVLAQATETATDHVPPRTKPVVADADSTNGDNNVEAALSANKTETPGPL